VKCPRCTFETENEKGFKMHMSKSHGGYNVDDLKGVGITPNQRDIARSLAGNTSAQEVTSQAPDKEPGPGDAGQVTRTRRSKTPAVDPEVERAKEQILRLRCQRIASLPYTLMANLLSEPSVKLNAEEEAMVTESYFTLAKAHGWEGASKLLLWGDVCICQAAVIAAPKRKEAFMRAANMFGQPEQVKEETQAVEGKDSIGE
jgi:hypothetical protein